MRRFVEWFLILSCAAPCFGWGTRGHELVAYLGYIHADSAVQARIDQLVALNPCYKQWQGVVAKDAGITADLDKRAALFMLAATWPDEIKHDPKNPLEKNPYSCQPGFAFATNDKGKTLTGGMSADVPPAGPEASQNIGYTDTRRHQYWHFVDQPYTTDGSKTYPAETPNAATELDLLTKALASGGNAQVNSYDLVWIAHLMGDLHQPLHNVARFSKALPNGDQGGNSVLICAAADKCGRDELHAYWDALPGSDAPLHVVIAQGKQLDAQTAKLSPGATDFGVWGKQSLTMAEQDAYAKPFDTGSASVLSSAILSTYHAKAVADMQQQVELGGLRLAQVLNAALKNRKDSCCKAA
ncbi:MAG TPA: S1/P1 nuclease [Acidobacteriaceae bacterium]|nr:S1/P1 nuclease [Acidobacteriaceae bacterium]